MVGLVNLNVVSSAPQYSVAEPCVTMLPLLVLVTILQNWQFDLLQEVTAHARNRYAAQNRSFLFIGW
jgi:hypothetical protein